MAIVAGALLRTRSARFVLIERPIAEPEISSTIISAVAEMELKPPIFPAPSGFRISQRTLCAQTRTNIDGGEHLKVAHKARSSDGIPAVAVPAIWAGSRSEWQHSANSHGMDNRLPEIVDE